MLTEALLVLGLALAQPPDVTNSQSAETGYFPPNLFLVRALTMEVNKKEQHYVSGTLLVTHVYTGTTSFKGKTFECTFTSGFQISGGGDPKYRHVGFLEENVEGLWWIYVDKDKKLVTLHRHDSRFGLGVPSR